MKKAAVTIAITILITTPPSYAKDHIKNHIDRTYKKSSKIIKAIAKVESNFDHLAVSKSGAMGVMQIHPIWIPTLKGIGLIKKRKDLFDPIINIQCGFFIYKYYLQQTEGNVKKALFLYSGKKASYPKRVFAAMKEM